VTVTHSIPATQTKDSAASAWLRALERTSAISKHPFRTLPNVIEEVAADFGERPALLSDHECLTYAALVRRSRQYSRWALDHGVVNGEAVCLLMPNRPEYLAIWLGITKVGGVVALLNTNLAGSSLAHSIRVVGPKHVIVAAELADRLSTPLGDFTAPTIWAHGACDPFPRRIEEEIERYSRETLSNEERRPVTIDDRALYIYTSGTTGLPKAANISHGRLMQWSHWFAGMMDTTSCDRMYSCLPMYHSSGGVQAPGAVLIAGGSLVIREGLSTREFWADIVRWDCTLFQYIGELCRYLLHSGPSAHENRHRVRMACGNGLRPEVWREFQSRFLIPKIFEFYAATEGVVSLFNIEGEVGAVGRIPGYLAHRSPVALIKFDYEREVPLRSEPGFCIPCAADEIGEAIGPLRQGSVHVASRFEGYTDEQASNKKVIRNVFKSGDAWFRTGDLMRKDKRGFFYFVDRIGDTFRWKGENVAASEVAETIGAFPGIKLASVYGVTVPGTDGRAGMAAVEVEGELDLVAFRRHLLDRLPRYACPLFIRIRTELELTGTFKCTKTDLVRQGYDPLATADAIYFNHPEHGDFIRLDQVLYEQIQAGQIRL